MYAVLTKKSAKNIHANVVKAEFRGNSEYSIKYQAKVLCRIMFNIKRQRILVDGLPVIWTSHHTSVSATISDVGC